MSYFVLPILLLIIKIYTLSDKVSRLGETEQFFLLSITRMSVRIVSFIWIGCVVLLWHSLGLPYTYFETCIRHMFKIDATEAPYIQTAI